MADHAITLKRHDELPQQQQQQQERFDSIKRFHIVFASLKQLVFWHFNSQHNETLSHTVLLFYIISVVIYLIALIKLIGPSNPNLIYKYLYIIFGTLGSKLLLWTRLSLAMWLVVNMCLLVFAFASSGLLV